MSHPSPLSRAASPGRTVARRSPRRLLAGVAAAALALGLSPALPAPASAIPAQNEPGVTMRAFQLGSPIDAICELKAGQTPNVDQLKSVIDWDSPEDFGGLQDNFVVEATAALTVETAGTYEFRLISDDGSRLTIDDQVVIDHDGLHGADPKDGSTTLTAGDHDLVVDFFEAAAASSSP